MSAKPSVCDESDEPPVRADGEADAEHRAQ